MRLSLTLALVTTLLVPAVALHAATATAADRPSIPGAIFTMTNDPAGNGVVMLRRGPQGALSLIGTFDTGGLGTGGGLGSQGALALDRSGRHLFVVNPGSDSLSVFSVDARGLTLLDVEPSGGELPISVAVHGDLAYVVHAEGDGGIAGFELMPGGDLVFLEGSERPLSGPGSGPAQIGFSPRGDFLVVTEKGTNSVLTYEVGNDGLPGDPVISPSSGVTPFGFSFGLRGRLFVSEAFGGEADASAASSYEILDDGFALPITASLPTTESAACWLVVNPDGRYAYITNTGSSTVTGVRIARDGSLTLLDEDGATGETGAAPIDAAFSRDGRFLFTLDSGDDSLSAFRVRADGGLEPLEGYADLPAAAAGLAAR